MLHRIATPLLLSALALGACGGKIDPRQESGACSVPATVTYQQHIKPLMARYCTRCHAASVTGNARNGAPSTSNWDTFAVVAAGADRVWGRLKDASMPPAPPKLTACEVKTFRAWMDTGKKEK